MYSMHIYLPIHAFQTNSVALSIISIVPYLPVSEGPSGLIDQSFRTVAHRYLSRFCDE